VNIGVAALVGNQCLCVIACFVLQRASLMLSACDHHAQGFKLQPADGRHCLLLRTTRCHWLLRYGDTQHRLLAATTLPLSGQAAHNAGTCDSTHLVISFPACTAAACGLQPPQVAVQAQGTSLLPKTRAAQA